jgi:hypothetical protein
MSPYFGLLRMALAKAIDVSGAWPADTDTPATDHCPSRRPGVILESSSALPGLSRNLPTAMHHDLDLKTWRGLMGAGHHWNKARPAGLPS